MSIENEKLTFTTSSYFSDQLLDGATQVVERYKEEADNIIKELKKLRKGGAVMSREKQIEEMARMLCGMKNGCDKCMFNKVNCNERSYAEEFYNAGYRKQPEWISVEDRLPDREGTYLVYTYKGAIKFGDFRRYYASGDEPQFDYYVTHWMPLPEAPKMKGGK